MRHLNSKFAFLGVTVMLITNTAAAFENSICMTFVRIPAGKFTMGSPAGELDRLDHENQHEVEITRDFYLGIHEVTIGQFQKFVAEEGYKTDAEQDGQGGFGFNEATEKFEGRKPQYIWKNTGWKVTDDHPVVNVSWNDAKAFCAWLSRKEKKTYRLPTEAEWEYACRAGSKTAFQNGDDPEGLAQVGNVADGTAKAVFANWKAITAKDTYVFTAPVGKFQKNAFGLFDMHGNVWEWCEDRYDSGNFNTSPQRDPTGPSTGSSRAFRGGSLDRAAERCRSAARGGNAPTYRNFILGFRVGTSPPSVDDAKLPAIRILETAKKDRFGMFGVKGANPAPTLFIFATTLENLGEYTDVGRRLLKHGVLTVALDPPCHGADLRAEEPPQLRGWRARVEKGEALVDPFTARARAVLDHLIEEGITDPEKVAVFGVSRGGFLAFHFAASDPRVKAVAAISPVTRLSALTEFAGLENDKAVEALTLVHLADKLAGRPVWISIGNNDARVDTDAAIAFTRKLVATRKNRNQAIPVELIVGPSLGHQAIERANELAAQWLGQQLGF